MKCRNKGLTLVEVLVAVTILSILALSVYTVFKSGIDVWSRSEARLEIYQSGRAVLDQISREIVGAFSDSGTGAKLVGTKGATEADSDKLEFITDFSDSIYKIRYQLAIDLTITTKKALERSYIDYSVETEPYGDTAVYSNIIEFVPAAIEASVSNIKFKYLPVTAPQTGMDDWAASGMDEWPGGEDEYDLPEAIKIILTLTDSNNKNYTLETEIYLPNSEVE